MRQTRGPAWSPMSRQRFLFRTRRKPTASTWVWRAAGLTLGGLGAFALYLAAQGLWSGEVMIFSKRVSGTLAWEQTPWLYAGTVAAWLAGGAVLVRLGMSSWRDA